jgi:hypothetical protein
MSTAQNVMANLLASADIRINGDRPWDILLHDERFFSRVLASGTLGFGESYMEGWWDCDALDEMCCHAIRAGVEKRFAFRLPNSLALLTALLANQQTLWRSRKVGRVHYDLSNDFFEAMLDPNMQYSCALFAEDDGLASAQLRKLDWICERLRLRPGLRLLDIGCGWVIGPLCRQPLRLPGSRDNNFTGAIPLCATLVSRIGHGNPAARLPRNNHRGIRSGGKRGHGRACRAQKLSHLYASGRLFVRQGWIISLPGNLRTLFATPCRSLDPALHFPKFRASFPRSPYAHRGRRVHR